MKRETVVEFQVPLIRECFPALERPNLYLDNPAGTQIARQSVARMYEYLVKRNANAGGVFATSVESDRIIADAREAMADFLNAGRRDEIVFGPNMTSITFDMTRIFARGLKPGDAILVTHMDHDANIAPWVQIARERDCEILQVDFDPAEGALDLDDFRRKLERGPKFAAFGYASNVLGTINPVREMTRLAREAGATTWIDAVQYAPHGPIDVQEIGCDFLVCSAYKFFGPHVGVLFGRYELLDALEAYKVRPASNRPPGKFERGTQNHEGIAGVFGAIEYFEWLGAHFGRESDADPSALSGRRVLLKQAMNAIREHEKELSARMIEGLRSLEGATIFGISDLDRLDERLPTVSFRIDGIEPARVSKFLAEKRIQVWDGNAYAVAVTERLGLEDKGGIVRAGAVHYNTPDEIDRLLDALRELQISSS